MTSDEPLDPFDPFDGVTLDDAWATGATLHEPPARVREARAAFLLEESEQEERAARAWHRRRTRRRRNRALVLFSLLLFAAAVAVADHRAPPDATWASADDAARAYLTVDGAPTPKAASSAKPLGEPSDPGAAGGDYLFVATQANGTDPVTYDPCRPVNIVINEQGAPVGTKAIIKRAVARAAEVSGLDLTIEGTTTEPAADGRTAFQPDRYGDRWAPVLIAWSDGTELPMLAGDVVGIGGSVEVPTADGPATYVSGMVALDAQDLQRFLDDGPDGAQAVEDAVLHELGHVVGLDHVGSRDELMYPEGQSDLHGYQQGDKTGLTKLGQGECIGLL